MYDTMYGFLIWVKVELLSLLITINNYYEMLYKSRFNMGIFVILEFYIWYQLYLLTFKRFMYTNPNQV